tara:strand:+ start:6374 stop:6820 length:447 start_codon:yes stop_codon:yes gene_type:complete
MDIQIDRMRCVDLQEQGTALMEANGAETGMRELDIDWGFFRATEASGNLLIFGARVDEELVGYVAGMFVASHPQHRNWAMVQAEVLYVAPDFRGTGATDRLMAALSQAARALRASSILWGAKVGTGFEQVLDRRDRFRKFEVFYEQEL